LQKTKAAAAKIKPLSPKTIIYALIFGALSAVTLTFAMSVFVPKFFPQWTGSLVCEGRIEFVIFKQSYFCFTAPNTSFDIGDAMFWAVFKRFMLPDLALCFLLSLGFVKLAEFAYQRREAAGF